MAEPTPTLRAIAEYRGQAQEIDHKLHSLISQARAEGASFEQIGQALGVTRQAAHQRFLTKGTPMEGRFYEGNDEGLNNQLDQWREEGWSIHRVYLKREHPKTWGITMTRGTPAVETD